MSDPAIDFAEDARAENTRRAYAADQADFASWCSAQGLRSLPAEPTTVARYLTAKAGELRVSTLARRLAGIRTYHRDSDLAPPDSAELRRTWAGIRRRLGRPPEKKAPLLLDTLERAIGAMPATPRGLRDKALVLMMFSGALRRSEISGADIDGPGAGRRRIKFVAEGVELQLDVAKGVKDGRGVVVPIPMTGTGLCPVAALEAWLAAAKIRSGAAFRKVDRWGNIGSSGLSDGAIAGIVKKACAAIGLNPRVFSGHSPRRGMATSAHRAGRSLVEIQRGMRHARPETSTGYIEEADRFAESLGRIL
jgi:integrase